MPLDEGHPSPGFEGWGQDTQQALAPVSSAPAPGSACHVTENPTFPGDVVEGRVLAGREEGPTADSITQRSSPTPAQPRPGLPVHHQSRSLCKLTSVHSVMPSSPLILCRPLLLPPSILPSIRVFASESALRIR